MDLRPWLIHAVLSALNTATSKRVGEVPAEPRLLALKLHTFLFRRNFSHQPEVERSDHLRNPKDARFYPEVIAANARCDPFGIMFAIERIR